MKGIALKDTNAKSNALAIHSPQITRPNGFLSPKVQDFPKTFVVSDLRF
jgi:hypothetical protein